MAVYYADDYLENKGYVIEHHGIKGQKWYHRRFQNPDGTLTEAGRKKYSKRYVDKYRNKRINKHQKKLVKWVERGDELKANRANRNLKALKKMSDDDIRAERIWGKHYGATNDLARTAVNIPLAFLGMTIPDVPSFVAIQATKQTTQMRQRCMRFASDYKDLTMSQLEKEAQKYIK
jgi:hypothetical protein